MPSASISAPWPRAARAPRWRPVVVVADEIAADAVARLRHCCDVRDATAVSREQLAVALGDADALVVRSSTIVDAALMSCAPRLQVIGRAGVGLDNIAVDAAADGEPLDDSFEGRFRRHQAAVNACFEAHADHATRFPRVEIVMTVSRRGVVRRARVSPDEVQEHELGACLRDVATAVEFAPQDAAVRVRIPITAREAP